MVEPFRQDETGHSGSGGDVSGQRQDDLDRRRRELDAKLSVHRPKNKGDRDEEGRSNVAGFGNALKLSSEFIAGIVVGAGIGWFVDQYAGTSPWGLVVFLFLGFGAGVLNVLRSAGLVAEPGSGTPGPDRKKTED